MGRKKTVEPGKRYGTMIRVSDAYAELLRKAASLEKCSIATYLDAHLFEPTRKLYAAALAKESKKVEGKER